MLECLFLTQHKYCKLLNPWQWLIKRLVWSFHRIPRYNVLSHIFAGILQASNLTLNLALQLLKNWKFSAILTIFKACALTSIFVTGQICLMLCLLLNALLFPLCLLLLIINLKIKLEVFSRGVFKVYFNKLSKISLTSTASLCFCKEIGVLRENPPVQPVVTDHLICHWWGSNPGHIGHRQLSHLEGILALEN